MGLIIGTFSYGTKAGETRRIHDYSSQNPPQAENLKTTTPNPEPKPQINNPKLQRRVCRGRIVLLPNEELQKRIICTYIKCIIKAAVVESQLCAQSNCLQNKIITKFVGCTFFLISAHHMPPTGQLVSGKDSKIYQYHHLSFHCSLSALLRNAKISSQ